MSSTCIKFTDLSSLPSYSNASAARLKSLYADISSQKHSNPASYQSTVQWWRDTLQAVVLNGWLPQISDHLVLHASPSLADSFRYEGIGKPLCLATAIAELRDLKAYVPANQFLSSTQSVYDPRWLPSRIANYIVGMPLWWVLKQLNLVESDETGGHQNDVERWKKIKGDYVLLDLVETASQAVISHQRIRATTPTDRLYTVDTFREEFATIALPGAVLSDLDVRILVKYLERDSGVIKVDREVIKFVDQDATESQSVTPIDHGILELKLAIHNLRRIIDNIQQKILDRTTKATAALRKKQKEVALSHLRSRKQLDDLLNKRIQALENLESTLISVEHAAGDVAIMRSYESSTATLRSILSHPLLQRDKIEETMDAMFSATKDAEDVDEAIRLNGDMGHQFVDEDELEAELKAMVEEIEQQKAEAADTARIQRQQQDREAAGVSQQHDSSDEMHEARQAEVTDSRFRFSEELTEREQASMI